jgi:hypothetical protein
VNVGEAGDGHGRRPGFRIAVWRAP